MPARRIVPGDVIRLFFQTTKPPKFKRCVVARLSPSPMLLLINSEVNEFVINTVELEALQILIDRATHGFMDTDSWIDCSQIFGYPVDWIKAAIENDPRQHLGRVNEVVRQDIIDAFTNTRLHSPKKKSAVIQALAALGDDD